VLDVRMILARSAPLEGEWKWGLTSLRIAAARAAALGSRLETSTTDRIDSSPSLSRSVAIAKASSSRSDILDREGPSSVEAVVTSCESLDGGRTELELELFLGPSIASMAEALP